MSVAGDLTTEEVRAALGGDADHMTSAEIEEYRIAANVLTEVACDRFRQQHRAREKREVEAS
jgi:hypothetical protein